MHYVILTLFFSKETLRKSRGEVFINIDQNENCLLLQFVLEIRFLIFRALLQIKFCPLIVSAEFSQAFLENNSKIFLEESVQYWVDKRNGKP